MTIELFIFLFTVGSTVSSLLTQAIKKNLKNLSCNIIALINAGMVGMGGTIMAYVLMDIEFTPKNVVCLILMTFCLWIGSTVGEDKVLQTIAQLKGGK